jgi:hypothetical protein
VEYRRVTQTFVRRAEGLVLVTIEGEEGAPLGTTEEHPFYVHRARDSLGGDDDGEGRWVPAGQLRAGDRVRRPSGEWVRVLRTEFRAGAATVYNFEVAVNHTYFVSALGVLVHNQCQRGRNPGPTVDPATGQEVGRIVVDSRGNAMIEPVGGRTVPAGHGGVDTHTLYPNGSNYQRLNPFGHKNNPTPHGHGHLPGTGPNMKGQGASIDPFGNVVPPNSGPAHWPIR